MSFVSDAIAEMTRDHSLDPATDYCKSQDDCKLKSGHEVTFVSLIANLLFSNLQESSEENLKYHEWVYMPSRRAEARTGYDLSIGKYDQPRRIRSMHKLLLRWCDDVRSWSLNPGHRDHKHLIQLLDNYLHSPDARPYLFLHVSYCVHDYRRMGVNYGDITLPEIKSLLRTLIIPFKNLADKIGMGPELEKISLIYNRDTYYRRRELPQRNLDRLSNPRNHHARVYLNGEEFLELPIVSLSQWQAEAVAFLLNKDE
jgi:hypothetical protein